jgi:hypothetical protein
LIEVNEVEDAITEQKKKFKGKKSSKVVPSRPHQIRKHASKILSKSNHSKYNNITVASV